MESQLRAGGNRWTATRAEHYARRYEIGYILLGIVLALGAVSLAGYRHVYEPRVKVRQVNPDRVSATRSADRSVQSPATRGPTASAPAHTPTLNTWSTFEMIINVLNVVVGIVGIVLAVIGLKAQRAARIPVPVPATRR